MTQAKQRRPLSSFDARSVMLFAALSVGGALVHAQPSSTPAASANQPAQVGPGPAKPAPSFGPAPAAAAPAAPGPHAANAANAVERADTNRDGQLSASEAARLPAIGNRFKQLDKDGSGGLSRAEFEAGAKS